MDRMEAASARASTVSSLRMRWWIIAIPVLLINTIAQMDKIGLGVIMANKQFLKDLGLIGRPAVTGALMSSFLLSYAVFHFFWAWFVKKYGARTSAFIGVSVWGVTLILSGIAQTAGEMIVARIILGVSEAVLYPMATAFVANWFPVKERGRATAIWMGGNTVGGILIGAFVVAVAATGGWRMVFYILGVLNILIPLPMLIFLMRNRPSDVRWLNEAERKIIDAGVLAKTEEVPKAEVRKGYIGNYRYWIAVICWGFNNIYFWGWSTWMPTYFQTVRHFSFKSAGYIYSLSWVFMLGATLLIAWLSDRLMRRAPFGGLGYLIAGILIFVGVSVVANAYWAVVVLIIAGCFQGIGYSMLQALFHSIVPERSMAVALGIGGGVSQLMGVASPTVIGFLLGASGFTYVVGFCGVALIIPGILVLILAKQGY